MTIRPSNQLKPTEASQAKGSRISQSTGNCNVISRQQAAGIAQPAYPYCLLPSDGTRSSNCTAALRDEFMGHRGVISLRFASLRHFLKNSPPRRNGAKVARRREKLTGHLPLIFSVLLHSIAMLIFLDIFS